MKKVIVIVGPTAIGKSHIGIEIAKRLNTSIISGDSVQVYKGLDIGSAKVTKEEMDGVKHYLIDELEPNEDYSVADFQKESRKLMEEIDIPLIVGGTGLYIKAAISNYDFDAPKRDSSFAESLKGKSNEELYDELLKVDLEQAKLIHPNNRKRVLRALEAAKSNNPLGEKRGKDEYLYDAYIVYLDAKREILYDRINKRVDLMFEEGLVEEVTDLYNKGVKPHAIGYQEFIPYFESNSSLDEVKEEIKLNTRHLAKRQTTFFKHQFVSNFYNVNLNDINQTIEEIYKDILEFLK